ncbi:MAG: flotillin family protein, partial [Saprospiraceae bacterium]
NAAAKAINDAKQSVAEKNRDGSIGEANANKEKRVSVSAADAIAKVGEATAEANAMDGENAARVRMAISSAERRQKEAEALRGATAAEKIQAAKSLQESYVAEKDAELARADRERASREADIIVQSEIAKRRIEIDADAEAARIRIIAKGESDAVFMRKEAEAKGMYEILQKQADGFDEVVKAAGGNPRDAVLMLIADKLPELLKIQVEAIKNIKIDKVTVWEGGGQDGNGSNTSKFISGMYKSVPPLSELFNMAGMELPGYLGKEKTEHEENGEETKKLEVKNKKENTPG